MTAKFDVSTLNWVKGEIDESLNQARLALEAFVATPDDETQMRFCVMHLHQVRGTLQMVELYGAAQTADEMEQLANAMQEHSVQEIERACEVLMRAVLQLPDYLEGLQAGQTDNALLLLPLINEMRRLHGADPIPETDYFKPDLRVMPPAEGQPLGVDIRLLSQKARPYYQSSLLHLLRGEEVVQSLKTLRALADKLLAAASSPALRQWFWIFGGFAEALADNSQSGVRAATKPLLSKGEQVIKLIGEGGEEAVPVEQLAPMLTSMLFQIAQSQGGGARLRELRQAFGLEGLLAAGHAPVQLVSGFNAELKKTLAGDILEELTAVQDALDIFVRSEERAVATLAPMADTLTRLASTLAMLGQGVLQQALEQQARTIQQLQASSESPSDRVLMDIASAVLAVDSALRDWGNVRPLEQADDVGGQVAAGELSPEAEAEHQRVIRQVMKEAKNNLLRVKDAVDAFVAAPGDAAPLTVVPNLLHEIVGSLNLLSYKRVAQVLRACSLYINNDLAKAQTLPGADMLDALADALTSVEYYLDAFVESRVHPAMVLEVAERAVAKLGYAVDSLPEQAAVPREEETAEEEITLAAPALEEVPAPLANEAAPVRVGVSEVTATEPRQTAAPKAPQAPVPAKAAATASADIDEEIVEIFIEEATEEISKVSELLPRWQGNRDDEEALRDLRRCFHTLKGSGRLVGASVLGEFAWAFENMLNRVIDKTVEPTNAMFDLLQQGLETLPELVEQFRSGAAVITDLEWLQQAADAMSKPGGLEALLEEGVPAPAPVAAPEVAKAPVAATPVAEALEIDPVLLEIYANETEGHLAAVEAFVSGCRSQHVCRVNETLTRALHTLQGSSRMAGVIAVADISLQLEKYAKALHTSHASVSDEGLAALEGCVGFAREMLAYLQGQQVQTPEHHALYQQAETLHHMAQRMAEGLEAMPEADLAQVAEAQSAEAAPAVAELEEEITLEPMPAEEEAPPLETVLSALEVEEIPLEPLAESETEELVLEALPELEDSVPELTEAEELTAGVGLGGLAPAEPEAEEEELVLAALPELEEEVPELVEVDEGLVAEELPELEEVVTAAPVAEVTATAPVAQVAEYDPELLDIFLEEGAEILDASEESLQAWREQPDDRSLVEALQRQLHTLKGGARMAGVTQIGDLGHTLETIFEDVVEGRLTRSSLLFDLLQLAHDRLVVMLDQVRNNEPLTSADDLIRRINALAHGEEEKAAEAQVTAPAPAAAVVPAAASASYLMQAQSLLDACEIPLRAWAVEQDKQPLVLEIDSKLHALHGLSHAAGIHALAELAQTQLQLLRAVADGRVRVSGRLFGLIQRVHERFGSMLNELRRGTQPASDVLLTEINELLQEELAETEAPETVAVVEELPVVTEVVSPEPVVSEEEMEAARSADRRRGQRLQHDVVRVRSDLLDNLVNFAGEVSIYRSRVEQQVGSVNYNLRDFSEILERLREQLRQFNIETEAQMQSRYEDVEEGAAYEDFDPLEFDRFTHMQQLSRSAMESLNDLEEVQQSLHGITRETETLLLQQARVNTELQEGLMHTRMVPLVENAPRLRRIVRQTCADLGKEVELKFQGAEVEMDRHMVERMLAPIEHLLRNAIAHGIESPKERQRAGKPRGGQIIVAQVREGSEVVLRIIDDGAGINLEKVRRKAIARGLMKPDAGLSDKEVMHFILESGFSTADTLTQIAGRGVGMDVVNSEIKQLGGLLEIDTRPGEGTTFTMRLPLTLSVSRALLVEVGEEVYAVPMTTIQGIERIEPARLEKLLANESPTYQWLTQEYELLRLNTVLGVTTAPVSEDVAKRPILFAHSGDHYVAWTADNLLGSREIVVKSLGPQLSTLRGLSGATILGDGRVALILDLPLLARLGLAQRSAAPVVEELPISTQPLIMVVDDSITVRKVTSRLLERNDMKPVTAKDGVDAIAQLEDVMPDVMLLDIEMPRMDGYELATHIRNTPRLKNIPIIMITSRSGEKHRQRAMEIGVDVYMSKPYQETELLENIRGLMAKRRGA